MWCSFKKNMGIVYVIWGLTLAPATAGHFFVIKKSDAPSWREDELTSVTLSKKVNTYQIAKNPALLFPDSSSSDAQKKYKLTIDLKGVDAGSLVNISIFLSELSQLSPASQPPYQTCQLFVPLLVLENSTSFKFNKIFPGITDFFNRTPEVEIQYSQLEPRFPRAAQKGFSTLEAMQKLPSYQPLGSPDPLQKLTEGVERLTLKAPSLPLTLAKPLSPKFLEIISRKNEGPAAREKLTDFPAEMLKRVVNYEEVTELKEQWEEFAEEWPPLGVVRKEQIHEIYIDNFGAFSGKTDLTSVVVLEVSGLLNDNRQAQKVIDFCWQTPSIRCVRIRDSMCILPNLEGFFQSRKEKDGKETTLLGKEKIRFLDIETAIDADARPIDLPQYFKNKKQENFLDFLIWDSSFSPVSPSFSPESKRNHQRFDAFLDYLNLLRSPEYLDLIQPDSTPLTIDHPS